MIELELWGSEWSHLIKHLKGSLRIVKLYPGP
jgi:hypothetical protein